MAKRKVQPPVAPPEPEVQVEAVVVEEFSVTETGRPKSPCTRFRLNQSVTPSTHKGATRQYSAGGEYNADEFLAALWDADDPAVSPAE